LDNNTDIRFINQAHVIGERIKQLRTEKKLTQEELGKLIGVTTSIIGMYETGARKPSLEVMELITDYFQVSVDYMLARTEFRWNFLLDQQVLLEIDSYIRKIITHYCQDDFSNLKIISERRSKDKTFSPEAFFIGISGVISLSLSDKQYQGISKLNFAEQKNLINALFIIRPDLKLVPRISMVNFEGKYINDKCEDIDTDNLVEKSSSKCIPIFGNITDSTTQYECVPEGLSVDFCIRVKGDSMINARILDGDLVYIRQQSDVESGEIAAISINGGEAILKRVSKINDSVILRDESPNYSEKVYFPRDMLKSVKILGKAVQFKSKVR
jgi:repressor LexA